MRQWQMQQSAPTTRRQFARRPLQANAIIHFRGRFQPAKIVDYSAGGLQLEGTFGLIRRDPIEVELISGTRMAGQVAWSLGGQTGIVFSQPLPTNHPALIELSRRADKAAARTRAMDHVVTGTLASDPLSKTLIV